ncbi:MAG TPA: hypothetical protein VJ867_17250 [Gemmatimonadaceae bacterium]|nr:hypothetical protein [Gemmatimonadaceae bacterium]
MSRLTIALVFWLLSCDRAAPKPPCDCDGPGPFETMIIGGAVGDGSESPVAGVLSWWSAITDAPCDNRSQITGAGGATTTDTLGRFRHDVHLAPTTCFRVWAMDYGRHPPSSDTQIVNFAERVNGVYPESVDVTLHFH